MNLQHLQDRQQKERNEFMEECKEVEERFYKEQDDIKAAFKGRDIPQSIQNILDINHRLWQKDWGVNGTYEAEMNERHEKEVEAYHQKMKTLGGLKEALKESGNQLMKGIGR